MAQGRRRVGESFNTRLSGRAAYQTPRRPTATVTLPYQAPPGRRDRWPHTQSVCPSPSDHSTTSLAGWGVLSQSSIFGQNPKIWCQEFN